MINITKSYLKVWKLDVKEKFVSATTTSSKKDKANDTWINSNWNVRFVGKCLGQAKELKEGDKIVVINGTVENVWDKVKEKAWVNVVVFEFELQEKNEEVFCDVSEDDNELPF